MLAPNGYGGTRQVEILNTTIDTLESGRDVIGSTIMGSEAYADPVNKALDNDIMFFQWNTTTLDWTPEEMRSRFGRTLPYVGQRAYPAGAAVGVTALEKADELIPDQELVVQPTLAVPGHPALENRTRGIRAAFEQSDRDVTLLDTLDIGQDISEATSRITDAYNANDGLNVVVGSGFWGPNAASSLIDNEGLQGEFVNGGFDLVESTIDAIRNGTVTFTVGQDPYSQGYVPVQLAFEYMDRGIPPKNYITGVEVIDESSIDFADQRSSAWPDLVNWQEQNYNVN
jgi:ABC-type sugar transport system substrate-binding protein